MKLQALAGTLRFVLRHPLNRGRPWASLVRYVTWQIGSRLVPGPVAVPFIEGSRLLVEPGMTGATGVVYSQLPEYEEMAFALDALQEGDLFVDVGANVGVYTILAASLGAEVIAFEPIATAAQHLRSNVLLNGFGHRVELRQTAVGFSAGHLEISIDNDTVNRVLTEDDSDVESAVVAVERLDDVLGDREIDLLKIDVEGWEVEVLRGSTSLLESGRVGAVIVELNGSGSRFGWTDEDVHRILTAAGYTCVCYRPRDRHISRSERSGGANQIYVRSLQWAQGRVRSAPIR